MTRARKASAHQSRRERHAASRKRPQRRGHNRSDNQSFKPRGDRLVAKALRKRSKGSKRRDNRRVDVGKHNSPAGVVVARNAIIRKRGQR